MTGLYSKQNQMSARRSGTYDKVMASLKECPFCDLKKKYIIKRVSGMYLTVNLFPYTDGHLLIISQRHLENIGQLTKKEWVAIFRLILLAQKLLKKHLKIKDFALVYHQGHRSGRSLKHFHLSIIPKAKGVLKKEYQQVNIAPIDLARMLK